MCGIAGIVLEADGSVDSTDTLNRLQHRGPDSRGSAEFVLEDHKMWLGHTRLAIQDLTEAGAQPMHSADGRWVVTFNGEIYNHLDLRHRLARSWRGHSDTETLVEAIAEWGFEAAVRQLNGIFAVAALDRHARTIWLARDPFGIKPLYYTSAGGRFAFASEIRGLRAMTGRRHGLDRSSLLTFLGLRFVPSPHTLLSGVMRLAPGHLLSCRIAGGAESTHCYVSPTAATFDGTLADAVATYKERLATAVRRQLLSDVPVGTLLSGGIDSAMVAAMAVESGVRTPCFTVGYADATAACEIDEAAHTASVLGLPHHVVRVDHEDLWRAFGLAVAATEEPLVTTSVLPMWHLCKRARQDVTVVLTGQGSDELMGGYNRYQGELLAELPLFGRIVSAAEPVVARVGGVPDAVERSARSALIDEPAARFESEYAVFPAAWRKLLTGDDAPGRARTAIERWLQWGAAGRPLSSVERMMCIDMRLGLADDLLLYGDKVSMAHSLEARVPLLDTELVGFVESLPRAYKLKLGRSKIVHKQLAATYLPKAIVERPKKGFQVPFGTMARTTWRDRCGDMLLGGSALADMGIRRHAVQRIWDEHQRGFRDRSRQVFALLGLCVWSDAMRGADLVAPINLRSGEPGHAACRDGLFAPTIASR
jgi:asparagine synthase (glutamine-hydrolysing)